MPFQVAHKPTKATRDTVKTLYGAGVTAEDIAHHLGIALMTLRKHYSKELDRGSMALGEIAIKRLARDAKNAKTGMAGTTAAIWITKNIRGLNWKDKMDRTGDGATVQIGSGAKVVILPAKDGPQPQLARPSLMIEATPDMVEVVEDE